MENINKLTRLLGADRIMTPEDVQQILLGVMEILKNYKQGTESINEETKSVVNQLLDKVVEINKETVDKAGTILDERLGEVETVLKGLQQMIQDVEVIASNVKDGKDADEDRVIEEVVSRIKVDPTVLTVSAQEIRDKLSSLKEEDRLDKSAIKGLEKILMQKDLDYAIATLQQQTSFLINKGGLKTVSHDNTLTGDGTPENPLAVAGGGSGITLQTDGTPNGDQTLLNLQAGTNITLTDNGTGTVTIDAAGGSGSPGGSDTQLQYNNAGAFGGISGATTDGTTTTYTTGNLKAADVKASGSGGLSVLSNAGTQTALFGAGGGANNTFYGDVKLDYGTASTVPYIDASKNLISSATTPTELGYVHGVTSAIQTQLDAKQATITFGTGVQTALGVNIGSAGAPVLFNGALGTPSSGTVTNLTGTASININGTVGATTPTTGAFTTLSTSSTLTASTTIELGNASDTTLSRVSAGVIAVEGVTVATSSNTLTLTNKRPQPRTASSTTASTLTPDLSSANVYYRTTQTGSLTINAPTGTPVIGETIAIYVDSAGSQTLTMDSTYKAFGAAFPATTTAGKTLMITAQYNGTDWKTLWANAV